MQVQNRPRLRRESQQFLNLPRLLNRAAFSGELNEATLFRSPMPAS
jgi:hypothetical protein